MKKLFFIIGLFFSLSAMAQPTNYTKINMRYRWLSGMFDSALYVPRYNGTPSGVRVNETSVYDGMIAMDTTNNRLYIYSGGGWIRLAAYSEIAAYTAGNGLTLSGSQFKLGGTLTENTEINGLSTYNLDIEGTNRFTAEAASYFNSAISVLGTKGIEMYATNTGTNRTSYFYIGGDSIRVYPGNGNLYIDSIQTISTTTGKKVVVHDTTTGKVERIDPATLVTTPTLQQVLTAGPTLSSGHTVDFNTNTLKFNTNGGYFDIETDNAGNVISRYNVIGELGARLQIQGDGLLQWGDGTGLIDNHISRFKVNGLAYTSNNPHFYIFDEGSGDTAQIIFAKGGDTLNYSVNASMYYDDDNSKLGIRANSSIILNAYNSGGLNESYLHIDTDSIYLKPEKGVLNIDSLRTWSGISDTTHKKPMTWDTRNGRWEYAANWPQQKINLVFGAGSGADSDTTAFTTSAIYGSFYNDADTIVVTSMRSVLQGTSPDVTYKVWYNDSLNVEAGATALVTAGSQVTNTTTGTNVTSFDVTKIPPGVWVWVKTSTVATKPKYFSLTVNGYRK